MTKTLVVTDDAAIIRQKIKEAARGAGWEIIGEASNGKQAVERYLELRPTVMTIDLVMPEYDGIYALREILTADPDAKIIVVSAIGQKTVLQDAFKLGAVDFIVKPFDKQVLVKTLAQFAMEGELATAATQRHSRGKTRHGPVPFRTRAIGRLAWDYSIDL